MIRVDRRQLAVKELIVGIEGQHEAVALVLEDAHHVGGLALLQRRHSLRRQRRVIWVEAVHLAQTLPSLRSEVALHFHKDCFSWAGESVDDDSRLVFEVKDVLDWLLLHDPLHLLGQRPLLDRSAFALEVGDFVFRDDFFHDLFKVVFDSEAVVLTEHNAYFSNAFKF